MTLQRTRTGASSVHGRAVARILVAACLIVALSSAPFVQLSIRLLDVPLAPWSAAYVYSYFGAAALGVALLAHHLAPCERPLRYLGLPGLVVVGFGGWALLSATWTESADRTPTEALLMAMLLCLAVWFGRALSTWEHAVALFAALQFLILASVTVAVASPSGRALGSWIGVFASRNTLGPVAGLAVVACYGVWCHIRSPRVAVIAAAFAVIDIVALQQASSTTAVLALAASAFAVGISFALEALSTRFPSRALVPVAMGGVVVASVVVVASLGSIAGAFGKDTTLSDRRIVWDYLLDTSSGHRLLGFGYNAFWGDPDLVYPLYELTGSVYDSAHSTFVEVYVGLGIVGFLLAVAIALLALWTPARAWWRTRDEGARWWLAIATFCLVENLTESMISYHSMFWVLLVASAFVGMPDQSGPARPGTTTVADGDVDDTPTTPVTRPVIE